MDRVEILKKAKDLFLRHSEYWGMCHCIRLSYLNKEVGSGDLAPNPSYMFPKFNREFLEAPKNRYSMAYWWDTSDRESRIKAFDKLIKYYEVNGQGELQKGS